MGMGSWYPTLSAKNKDTLRMGHPLVEVGSLSQRQQQQQPRISFDCAALRSGKQIEGEGSRYPRSQKRDPSTALRTGSGALGVVRTCRIKGSRLLLRFRVGHPRGRG